MKDYRRAAGAGAWMRRVRVVLLGSLIIGLPSFAYAASWEFSQTGWRQAGIPNSPPSGGTVTGSFEGTDSNSDGIIALSELIDYSMKFRGDALIPNFKHDLGDLQFFKYTIGSGGFPPSFPLYSDNGFFQYDADDGVIRNTVTTLAISTQEPAVVRPVPIPGALPLFLTAIGGLVLVGRRFKTKQPV